MILTDTQKKILELKVGALVLEYDYKSVKEALSEWSPEALSRKSNVGTEHFFNSEEFSI